MLNYVFVVVSHCFDFKNPGKEKAAVSYYRRQLHLGNENIVIKMRLDVADRLKHIILLIFLGCEL